MDCPAALWLSRTDVSCDKRSCCCHPGRADTLHTLLTLASLSPSPLLDGTTAVPKWIPNESICQGLFAAGLDLMLLLCSWRDRLSLREPRAAGGQHLPQAWPGGTRAHFEQTELKPIRGENGFYFLSIPPPLPPPLPPKTTSTSASSTHPHVCVTEAGQSSRSRFPLFSQMFLIHFSQTQLHI